MAEADDTKATPGRLCTMCQAAPPGPGGVICPGCREGDRSPGTRR